MSPSDYTFNNNKKVFYEYLIQSYSEINQHASQYKNIVRYSIEVCLRV